jgi:hypothetical protein
MTRLPTIVAAVCLCWPALSACGPAAAAMSEEVPSLGDCTREIRELRADINLLNLYNGLNLTMEQVKVILREARSLARESKGGTEVSAREEKKLLEKERAMLADLKENLYEGDDVSHSLRSRYDNFMRNQWADKTRHLDRKYLEKVHASAAAVHAALTDAQLEVLRTYQPCLIPPRDLRDPVRVGQAADHTRTVSILERIRELPDFVYAENRDHIVAVLVKAAEKHAGKMSDQDRAAYADKVGAIIDRARAMNETEFLFNRQAMAAEVEPEDRIESIKAELAGMGLQAAEMQGKITRFFLTPRAVPIMEKRLEQMKAFERGEKTDLEKIKGAEKYGAEKNGKKSPGKKSGAGK